MQISEGSEPKLSCSFKGQHCMWIYRSLGGITSAFFGCGNIDCKPTMIHSCSITTLCCKHCSQSCCCLVRSIYYYGVFLLASSPVVGWPSLAEGGVTPCLPGWKLNFLLCTSHYRLPAVPHPLSLLSKILLTFGIKTYSAIIVNHLGCFYTWPVVWFLVCLPIWFVILGCLDMVEQFNSKTPIKSIYWGW